MTSATPTGERYTTGCERHPKPAVWREALREKLRECSSPGSCRSGDRLPEGVGVLSICHEGGSTKSVFLR
jgi:hypothetical protein